MTNVKVFYHYTSSEIINLVDVSQQYSPFRKPVGLWISDDSSFSWKDFCHMSGSFLEDLEKRYKIILKKNANILHLNSIEDILRFTDEYGCNIMGEIIGHIDERCDAIRWKEVAEKYDGIIITPYMWNWGLMRTAWWYYGWDCASGCIWNVSAIASCRLQDDIIKKQDTHGLDDRTV